MKQGWEIKKLEELAIKLFAGGDKPKVFSEHPTDVLNIPVYANGVSFDGLVGYTDKATVEKESITVSARGTIGFCCVRRTPFVPIVRLITIIPIESIKTEFLYYALSNATIENNGVAIPQLTIPMIKGITIPIPSIAEQERIVEVLDREFEKIDAMKANAEQNLQHAKDLFQAALHQELQPKEGWETKTIGEIAELKGGKRVPKGYKLEITPTGYPYIRVADFNDNGSVDLDDIHYISKEVFEGIKRYIITINDVYISIAGTIGKSGIIPEELNGANLTENACRLVFKEVVDKKYIYYCTISSDFKEQIIKLTMQAAQPKLALARLATATLNLPSVESQRKIVARLDILNERCKALEENYKKTIALCDDMKQALLRKAFNGEL